MGNTIGTAEFDPGTVLNHGIIAGNVLPGGEAARTLLITGLARSGTSMLAALLQAAGVWLGDHVSEPVHEDAEITQMLRARDLARLDTLIAEQNAKTPVWGFKMPDLHLFLQHDELQRFRNPRLIVIFRDPTAVAARNVLSEQVDGMAAIIETTAAMHAITQFTRASKLPFLFLSYEKALLFPQAFVDSVLAFCGIAIDAAARTMLLRLVQPNRAQYVMTSRRTFEGHLEGVLDGRLYGWARHIGFLEPVQLDLLIDDRLAATFTAGEFRTDLLAAGLGNGNHAFFVELDEFPVTDAAVIRVRINRRRFELENSGRSLAELKALREPG